MAAFTAYFDASGHPDGTPVLFVAGFVSTVEKWLKFEVEWTSVLNQYDIAPPFHMKEFAPGVGQYASWKHDKARRKAFLSEAIHIIKKRTHKSFSVGVVIEDLNEVKKRYMIPRINAFPYPLCALSVMERVMTWAERKSAHGGIRSEDRLGWVFENGDKHKGVLVDEISKWGAGILIPSFLSTDFPHSTKPISRRGCGPSP